MTTKREEGRQFYSDIATYAAGNILSLLLIFIIYQVNTVLSDFRDPMLYALLISTALRIPKDRLVSSLLSVTSDRHRILLFVPFEVFLIKPFSIIANAWDQMKRFVKGFRSQVDKARAKKKNHAYVIALVQTMMSRSSCDNGARFGTGKKNAKVSTRLLWFLVKVCLIQSVYDWIRVSWTASSQLALLSLVVTVLAGGAMISCVQYFSVWYPTIGPLSPRTPKSTKKRLTHISPSHIQRRLADSEEAYMEPDETNIVTRLMSPIHACDGYMKRAIQSSAHSLVAAFLILTLLLGTAVTAAFLGYQIVSEGRDAVLLLKDTISDPWSGSQPDDVWTNLPFRYRAQVGEFIQDYLPHIFEWVEEKSDYILDANNLTAAAVEGRYLMESMRGLRKCSEQETNKLLVSLAKATYEETLCDSEVNKISEQLRHTEDAFSTAVKAFQHHVLLTGRRGNNTIESNVVHTEQDLKDIQSKYAIALSNRAKAVRSKLVAERRLALCKDGERYEQQHDRQHAFVNEFGSVIQKGYRRILSDWDIKGGLLETWTGLYDIWEGVVDSNPTARGPDSSNQGGIVHLDSLQSMARAAVGPLVSLGRALFISVESTTSAALAGSYSLFRLGASVLQFGMQSLLFLSMLFALLNSQEDPFSQIIQLLPFPPEARDKAAEALNRSLGGVFVTLIKLCVIHGLFTWVTFKFFGAPLVYLSSTVSAAFSLVPLIPSYMVAIPALVALAMQGRIVSGIILFAMHFTATNFGDTEVLNEAGGQPYLMSLSVLGGMWAFYPNPFLGCLLGPILLSLLYALSAIHSELITVGRIAHGDSHKPPRPKNKSA